MGFHVVGSQAFFLLISSLVDDATCNICLSDSDSDTEQPQDEERQPQVANLGVWRSVETSLRIAASGAATIMCHLVVNAIDQVKGLLLLGRFMISTVAFYCSQKWHELKLSWQRSNNRRLGGAAQTSSTAFVTLTSEVCAFAMIMKDARCFCL